MKFQLSAKERDLMDEAAKVLLKNSQAEDAINFMAIALQRFFMVLALRFTDSHEDGEDLIQEFWLRFWSKSKFKLFKPEVGALAAWASRSFTNFLIDFSRLKKILLVRIDDPENGGFDFEDYRERKPLSDEIGREISEVIWQAVTELSPRQAEIFHMRYGLDLSVKQISEALDISDGTIKATLHRAKLKLQELLQEFYHENFFY